MVIVHPMSVQRGFERSKLDNWLVKLRFVYDSDLERVRNPFSFQHAEDYLGGPETERLLREHFVSHLGYFEQVRGPRATAIIGPQGAGKTANRIMLARALRAQDGVFVRVYEDFDALSFWPETVMADELIQQEVSAGRTVYILVDGAKGSGHDSVRVGGLVTSLLMKVGGLNLPGIYLKLFLPWTWREPIKQSPAYRTGMLELVEISWLVEQLQEVLRARFLWASKGRIASLNQISDPAVRQLRDADRALAEIAMTPGTLLELGQHLFRFHVQNMLSPDDLLLTLDDWNEFMRRGERVGPEVVSVETVPAARGLLRLELRSQEGGRKVSVAILGSTFDERVETEPRTLSPPPDQLPAVLKALRYRREPERLDPEDWVVLHELGLARQRGKQLEPQLERRVGELLYRTLVQSEVRAELRSASRGAKGGVILHLYFSDRDTVLPCYPWELLHDTSSNSYLVRSQNVHLIRHIISDAPAPETQPVPKQIHLMYVAPRPTHKLRLSRLERQMVQEALKELIRQEELVINDLSPSTFAELQRQLFLSYSKGVRMHVLHFDGYGDFGRLCQNCGEMNEPKQEALCSKCNGELDEEAYGYLVFERPEAGGLHYVLADEFADVIAPRGIQLVMISACLSATLGGASAFNSVAPRLILAKVPRVVGMQLPIGTEAAQQFARGFYEGLKVCCSAVDAMAYGRYMLIGTDYWYVPTLYLRSEDDEGHLFIPAI